MSAIVAIGEEDRVRCFALAGVRVLAAADREAVLAAWRGLGAEVGLALLTPAAHERLVGELDGPGRPLHLVLA